MFLFASYNLACTVIVHIQCGEYRFMVFRSERVELLQVEEEFRSDVAEIKLCVNIYCRACLLRQNMVCHIFLKSSCEFFHIFHLHRQSGSVCMSAEVLKQVSAMLYRTINIESGDRTCRACGKSFGTCEYHSRAIVNFCKLLLSERFSSESTILFASSVIVLSKSLRCSL